MTRKIGLTYTWTFTVHDAAGALSNADALPVAAVYEDDTDVSVDTPTVEQIGVLTGHYRVIAYLDPLIYTADHSYNVMVTMAVGGVSMGARVESFVAETANQTDILATLNSLISTVAAVVEDAVWDAARADHTDAGSMGETMTDAQTVVESLDEMIEDDGLGQKRFTEKTLEQAPATPAADMWAYVPTGLEPADSVAERMVDIDDNVGVPVALDGGDATLAGMLTKMADDNGGADFDATTDSLHESAGGGGGGPTKEEIRIEMDANSTRLAAIDQNTSDTVALVLAT